MLRSLGIKIREICYREVQQLKKAWSVLLVLCLLLTMSGCSLLPAEEETPPPPLLEATESANYKYTVAARGDVIKTLTLNAVYSAAVSEELFFGENGLALYLVHVSLGDLVQAGDVIAELDTSDIVRQLEDLEESITDAQEEIAYRTRQWELSCQEYEIRSAGASDEELAKIAQEKARDEAAYNAACGILEIRISQMEAEMGRLEEQKAGRILVAGITGTVTKLGDTSISYVSSTTKAYVEISDLSNAAFIITDEEASLFQVGMEVSLKRSGDEAVGVVVSADEMGVAYAANKAYIKVVGEAAEFSNGDKYKATVTLANRENVILVQNNGIMSVAGKPGCYVLDENGLIQPTEVEIGVEGDSYTEIISGISEGDRIVTNYV